MAGRLILICCGVTAAMRAGAFPRDEPLDALSAKRAAARMRPGGGTDMRWTSPALRARQTCECLSLDAVENPALADIDIGGWAGKSFVELERQDATVSRLWLDDPRSAPHGGESLADVAERVAAFMHDELGQSRKTIAVTHPAVIRLAVIHTLGAPLGAFRHIDVEPLSAMDLRNDGRRWTLRSFGVELPERTSA